MSEEKERSFDQEYDEWIKGLQEKIRAEAKSFMDRQDKLIMDGIKRANNPESHYKMGGLYPMIEPRSFGGKDDKNFWAGEPIQKGHPDYNEVEHLKEGIRQAISQITKMNLYHLKELKQHLKDLINEK